MVHADAEDAETRSGQLGSEELTAIQLPETERDALEQVMRQAQDDLASAHAEICKLQGIDPVTHRWPDWSPQANTLRWFAAIREKFNIGQA